MFEYSEIIASAPGRVDLAGRIDIPQYFFKFPHRTVGTLNISISLRTEITYNRNSSASIVFRNGLLEERGSPYLDPAASKFPYFWHAVRHFSAPTGEYVVQTAIPYSSGLGGSSSFVVTLLAIFFRIKGCLLQTDDEQIRLMMLAYLFENSIGLTSAGFQDYLSAIHGGANYWEWGALLCEQNLIAHRRPICSNDDEGHLFDDCILLAFTGEAHSSNRLDCYGRLEISSKHYQDWLKVGQLGSDVALLLRERRWSELATVMRIERDLHLCLTGASLSAKAATLIAIADAAGIGVRFAGVASGGSVWAIGDPIDIKWLHDQWKQATVHWPDSEVQIVRIDNGLTLEAFSNKLELA